VKLPGNPRWTGLSGRSATLPTKETDVKCVTRQRLARIRSTAEVGMTTAEYAVGTMAACAFAAVLLLIVKSDAVRAALASVITTALGTAG
jgi:hypothetical protein